MRSLILKLLIIVAGTAVATGCAFTETEEGRVPSTSAPAPDQSLVNEALQFSGVVLPPDAEVLGASEESGIDQLYVLAVAVDQGSVEALLAGSRFDARLQPGEQVSLPPVPGFVPATGDRISSAQDRFRPDGDGPAVFREILVDRTDPARPTVHIWAFTT